MDAIVKFKEAAKALQESDLYKNLTAARKANDEDEALQEMLREFNLVRLELNNEIQKDERDNDKVAELNQRVNRLYDDVMTNGNMLAYNDAKQDVEHFMDYVNAVINAAFDGSDPMQVEEPAEGCDPASCASCQGCP